MFRKVVISVLVISAGSAVWAAIAGPVGSGFTDLRLIPDYFVVLLSLAAIPSLIQKLSRVDRETNRAHNRTLHQIKWAGLATCMSLFLVDSLVRVWGAGTGKGSLFADVFLWQHLGVVFMATALGTAGLALYLRRADRPYPPGHCSQCGYDLTGLPEPRCPECASEFER